MSLFERRPRRSTPSVAPRLEHQRHVEVVAKRAQIKLIIVDVSGRVIVDSIDRSDHELRMLLSDDRTRFRGDIAVAVQTLVEECARAEERHSRCAFVDALRFVRVTRLDGGHGSLFAVSVEHLRAGDSLSRAARRYGLTPREIDVLAMMLEGASAPETAAALNIAETTVQGYHKRLLTKTQSRNRPAMVAKVLDWNGSRTAPAEPAAAQLEG